MINQKEITSEWISKVSQENKNADKILIEKVIRALLLLEGLVKQHIEFTFKGGTALMLHLNSTKRLSIDIDIILPVEIKELDAILDKVVKEQGFLHKELQSRSTTTQIAKSHYKFFYTPSYKINIDEDYILLDILFEKSNYQNIVQLPIDSNFVQIVDKPLFVNIPSLEDILGDKLTAFAPNTTGIPYFKSEHSMSMEIIKQLYDIGNLFDKVENLKIIKSTFSIFAKTELKYRNQKELKMENVTDDIFQTSLTIASRGIDGKGDFEQLQLGIQRIRAFIFSGSFNFNIDKAIIAASKAAYLATLIEFDEDKIEKYSNPLQMKDWLLDKPINTKLNKLKKSNPEAFFYWHKIYKLKTEEMELADAKNNIQTLSKTLATKTVQQIENENIKTKLPFNICVLGDVSEISQIRKEQNEYFEKIGVSTTDWGIEFFNNKKLKSSAVLRSLHKGQSKYSLIVAGQIFHHSGKENKKANIISELESDKYIPHCIGSNPKDLLTDSKLIETINEFVGKPNP